MLTLPTTQKGTAKLRPGRGIKVNYFYYWSDAFLDPDVEGTQVPVRYDPFDAGLAYAFIRKRWVRCISEHHARFAGRSEREIQLASAELRRRQQRHLAPVATNLCQVVANGWFATLRVIVCGCRLLVLRWPATTCFRCLLAVWRIADGATGRLLLVDSNVVQLGSGGCMRDNDVG